MLFINGVGILHLLHFQILQEEDHMRKTAGEEYITYMKHTARYFGKK